jgi:hypothetical protein
VTWVIWNLISVGLETVFVLVQDRCMVCVKCAIGTKCAQVEAHSVHLEIVLILTQERCTVCSEHTMGLKIVFDAHDGTPR